MTRESHKYSRVQLFFHPFLLHLYKPEVTSQDPWEKRQLEEDLFGEGFSEASEVILRSGTCWIPGPDYHGPQTYDSKTMNISQRDMIQISDPFHHLREVPERPKFIREQVFYPETRSINLLHSVCWNIIPLTINRHYLLYAVLFNFLLAVLSMLNLLR